MHHERKWKFTLGIVVFHPSYVHFENADGHGDHRDDHRHGAPERRWLHLRCRAARRQKLSRACAGDEDAKDDEELRAHPHRDKPTTTELAK